LKVFHQPCNDESSDERVNKSSQESDESSEQIRIVSDIERFHEADKDSAVSESSSGKSAYEQSDSKVDS